MVFYRNVTLTNTNTIDSVIRWFSISHLLLVLNYKLNSLLTPSCPCSMLSSSTLTLGWIDCVTSQRNVCVWGRELGLMFYASPLSVSLSFTFVKLFLFTQLLVCVLYLVRVLRSVHSPWSAVRSHILYLTVFILLIELKMCLLKWITFWEIIIADILLNCKWWWPNTCRLLEYWDKLSNFNFQWTKTLYQLSHLTSHSFLYFSRAIDVISFLKKITPKTFSYRRTRKYISLRFILKFIFMKYFLIF